MTLEFVGPLGVAVAGSRRGRDVVWALLAAVGIILLSDGTGGGGIDPLGAALALTAGGFWAAYILTRPLGASTGDLLSQPASAGGLGLGTTWTSVLFLAAILVMVIYESLKQKRALQQAPA